jgi:FKBP-type peptidyl-prolyl cis-trans isomerase
MRLLSAVLFMAAICLCLDRATDQRTVAGEKKEKVIMTSSGLKYVDTKEGTGPAAAKGDTVEVHYTGWLKDGTKFDSSKDRGKPFVFQLGAGKVIKGWDEGVQGMKVGGERKLMIPSNLAYGPRGAGGVIPPNADLTFQVELLKIQGK